VNLYILHNRRTPLQAEEALGPISIPQGSRGVALTNMNILNFISKNHQEMLSRVVWRNISDLSPLRVKI
jgi:hypothetical protein